MKWNGLKLTAVVGLSLLATPALATGPVCPNRVVPLPSLPLPHHAQTVTYETVITSSGDPALVTAPKVPAIYKLLGVRFPAVVVLQGGSVMHTDYSQFAERLARHGYVVIVPNHIIEFGGQVGPFTNVRVIDQAFEFVKEESAIPGSPIQGLVDGNKLAVVGHSLGGATTLQAVGGQCLAPLCFGTYTPPAELRAVAVYGGNMRNRPPATGFIDVDNVAPTAMIHGSEDAIATIADARSTFALLEESKSFFRVNGTNHYGINNANNVGGQPDVTPSMPQSQGIAAITDTTALYFDLNVKGGGFLDPLTDCFTGTADGKVTFEQ